jgi:hypothetical protein
MDDPNVMSRFKKALDATLEPEASEKLLQKYALAGALTSEQQYTGLLNLSTDLRFHFPVMKVAEGWADKESHKCLRYHFHQVRINDILKLEFRLTI